MEKKITKKDYYELLKGIVENSESEIKEDLTNFIDKEISLIETKAEKAKIRNAEKKANGDELRDAVEAVLTEDLQTADAILVQIEGEDLSKAKIVARLTQLVKAGIATKEDVKTEDNRTVKAYKLV